MVRVLKKVREKKRNWGSYCVNGGWKRKRRESLPVDVRQKKENLKKEKKERRHRPVANQTGKKRKEKRKKDPARFPRSSRPEKRGTRCKRSQQAKPAVAFHVRQREEKRKKKGTTKRTRGNRAPPELREELLKEKREERVSLPATDGPLGEKKKKEKTRPPCVRD